MIKFRVALVGLLGAALAVTVANGQDYVIDDGTNLTINVDRNFPATVILGNEMPGNGLTISSDVVVSADSLFVGLTPASANNSIELLENSALFLSDTLIVGTNSSGNELTTSAGALISAGGWGIIGAGVGAQNNQVMIQGEGSSWIMDGNLIVGYDGNDNTLQVADGALVAAGDSLYIGGGITADNNRMMVSNADVYVEYDVVVGYQGGSNELDIVDGSSLDSYNTFVGETSDADNNRIFISDGSTWANYGGLYIGNINNTGNVVTVTNGAQVVVNDGVYIFGTNNTFNLEHGGTLIVNTNLNASMDGFNYNDGSALYVGGMLSGATNVLEGGRTLGLLGPNGWWNESGTNVVVGGTSSSNALYLSAGGRVDAAAVSVGQDNTASGNVVVVTDEGTVLNVAGSLAVGSESNANNVVEVSNGGEIRLGGDLIMGGSSNSFNLAAGGSLVVSNGLDASQSGFNFLEGGTLESMGTLSGMDDAIEDERTIVLSGSNAVWDIGANLLTVGAVSSANTLQVLDGAYLASGDATIGGTGTIGNMVYVSGPGSLWQNAGNLVLDGYGNGLVIGLGGSAEVGNTLSVQNGARLSFAPGGYASALNYYQDASSVFAFDSVTNSPVSPALVVVDSAEFEGGATLHYTGSISRLARDVEFTNRLVSANTLIVNGATVTNAADLDVLNLLGSGSLLSINLMTMDDDLLAIISRMSLAESAGFEPGTDMADVSDAIDRLADEGNALADNMLNTLSQTDSATQNATLTQLYDRHAPTYAHTKGLSDALRQVRSRGVMPTPMLLPVGAMGPHMYGTQVQAWMKGYGSWGQRDATESFSDYDQSVYGALLGIDKSYGEVMAGAAGGMAISDVSQGDGDSSKATTGYGILYASVGTVSWFGDANLGYGRSSIEDRSGTMFDTSADYDADLFGFYLGGGKQMVFSDDRLFVTPSAAMSGAYYLQGDYTENSSTAVPRQVDDYEHLSYRSELGLKTMYTYELKRTALMPEIHVNWLHEFNTDEQRIGYSLVGDPGRHSFGLMAPVEDIYEVGALLSWWKDLGGNGKYHEWALGVDSRFGDGYTETTASLRLLGRF